MSTSPPGRDPRLPAGLGTALGGPRGRRAAPRPRPLAALAPVVLLLGLPLSVAALRQAGCTGPGWEGRTPLWRQCASPLVEALPVEGVGQGPWAYLTAALPLDLPPVSGIVVTSLAGLAPGPGVSEQRWFLLLWMLLSAVLLAVMVVAVGTVHRHPLADPVALALSPVLALTVFLSPALVPLSLAVVALWAWSRDRVRLAGVLAGVALLGGAASAAVLLAMALLPGRGGRRAVRELLVTAGVTALLVTAPVAALDARTPARPLLAWWRDGAGAGSPWFLPGLAGHPVGAGHVAVISVLGAVLAVALGVILARRRPPVADVTLLVLVVLALTATALPVGAALWLVPFVALAGVRWRDHLLWAGAEAVHALAWFTYVGGLTDPGKGLPAGWYATAVVVRLLAVGRLGWVVWSRRPSMPDHRPRPSAPQRPEAGSRTISGMTDAAGTLVRLPSAQPVDSHGGGEGRDAYPPVTEGP